MIIAVGYLIQNKKQKKTTKTNTLKKPPPNKQTKNKTTTTTTRPKFIFHISTQDNSSFMVTLRYLTECLHG